LDSTELEISFSLPRQTRRVSLAVAENRFDVAPKVLLAKRPPTKPPFTLTRRVLRRAAERRDEFSR